MKKTILVAIIVIASLGLKAQKQEQTKPFIGASLGVTTNTKNDNLTNNAYGIDIGLDFRPDSTKKKSFYLSTSFNNFNNDVVTYSFNAGLTLPVQIFKGFQFYYAPALNFMNMNNTFNFGVYNAIGFKIINKDKSFLKLEAGFLISKYGYGFLKIIYTLY